MEFQDDKIIIGRELSDLDKFAIEFVHILKKHTKYVIVSGYVSILLGRSRASEDIDLIVPKMSKQNFFDLYRDLKTGYFYCLNADDSTDLYEYLTTKTAIRFAKTDTVVPNIEFKFAKNRFDEIALENTITVNLSDKELTISHLELQIAFKESVLKSPKDIEDARHMRNVADKQLDHNLIKKYQRMLDGFYG
ncbi:MAG: hypothetical protein ABIF10_05595 [Candidatus Woesearchaeota archaeon]